MLLEGFRKKKYLKQKKRREGKKKRDSIGADQREHKGKCRPASGKKGATKSAACVNKNQDEG